MEGIYTGDRVQHVGSFVLFLQSPAGWLCIIFVIFMVFFIPMVEKKLQVIKDKRYYLLFPEEEPSYIKKKSGLVKRILLVIFNTSKKDALDKAKANTEDFFTRNDEKE